MKKGKREIIIFVLVVAVLLVGICFLVFKFNSKNYKYAKELKALAGEYYEEYYESFAKNNYTEEETVKTISRFKDTGRKESLDTLSRIDITKKDEILSKFKGCDIYNTKATVYPYEPYKKNDYRVVVTLDCE